MNELPDPSELNFTSRSHHFDIDSGSCTGLKSDLTILRFNSIKSDLLNEYAQCLDALNLVPSNNFLDVVTKSGSGTTLDRGQVLSSFSDIPSNTAESTIVAHFSAASLKTITFSLLSRENKMESAAVVVEVALFKSILAEGTCPAPSILAVKISSFLGDSVPSPPPPLLYTVFMPFAEDNIIVNCNLNRLCSRKSTTRAFHY
uniref:Bm14451 n=1 Tax=Brugia malayi TaxID=6279 RepID=A0A0J9XQD7_BRUMA|nr:Bm14451 [Brugia malayi]